jgi:hypothetical protein
MKDFTLSAYEMYLSAIRSSFKTSIKFDEYFAADPKPEGFCIIRHDVDRKPKNALKMAKLEHDMGIEASYFFRSKAHTFKETIIREIAGLGHEIGYHYESLSDANGDTEFALKDFERNLRRFRDIVCVMTISMHGRPFKPFDNRDLWRNTEYHLMLHRDYGIRGDVHLDIDYSDILYISDTGRNWCSTKSNIRDTVLSGVGKDFPSGTELLRYLEDSPHKKLVFAVHPERWTDSVLDYVYQWLFDFFVNVFKELR